MRWGESRSLPRWLCQSFELARVIAGGVLDEGSPVELLYGGGDAVLAYLGRDDGDVGRATTHAPPGSEPG